VRNFDFWFYLCYNITNLRLGKWGISEANGRYKATHEENNYCLLQIHNLQNIFLLIPVLSF
jgi:hypothetical protein